MGASLHHLLLDPGFWKPRLERLESSPRRLVVYPRPDLARSGAEVDELLLCAHDGARLRAFLGRPAFQLQGEGVRLRPSALLDPEDLDWEAIEAGTADVVFEFPPDRRLEDRVLDVVRVARAACSLIDLDCSRVHFRGDCDDPADDLAIAHLIRNAGWLTDGPCGA